MNNFKVEYFITVDQKDVFCRDKSSFDNFLKSFDGIAVQDNCIHYKSLEVDYELEIGNIAADRQRYFHAILSIQEENCIGEFEKFLRILKTALFKISREEPKTLWDDIGFYYAHQAYPLIHEIENIMRKLITKFMLTAVGSSWFEKAVPQEVHQSIKTKKSRNSKKDIYETDFIQLANFLFKKYTTAGSTKIHEIITKASRTEDLSLDELKNCLPQSNWERYFTSIVDCESDYLRKKWEKLYERRNQIAHNKQMSKAEFEEIQKLVNEIKPKLQEAVSKLDKVTLRADQRKSIVENAVENVVENAVESLTEQQNLQTLQNLLASALDTVLPAARISAIVKNISGGSD